MRIRQGLIPKMGEGNPRERAPRGEFEGQEKEAQVGLVIALQVGSEEQMRVLNRRSGQGRTHESRQVQERPVQEMEQAGYRKMMIQRKLSSSEMTMQCSAVAIGNETDMAWW